MTMLIELAAASAFSILDSQFRVEGNTITIDNARIAVLDQAPQDLLVGTALYADDAAWADDSDTIQWQVEPGEYNVLVLAGENMDFVSYEFTITVELSRIDEIRMAFQDMVAAREALTQAQQVLTDLNPSFFEISEAMREDDQPQP